MNHCGAEDGSRTQGRRSVVASDTKGIGRYWVQPFGIHDKARNMTADGDTEGAQPGGCSTHRSKHRV